MVYLGSIKAETTFAFPKNVLLLSNAEEASYRKIKFISSHGKAFISHLVSILFTWIY